MAAGPADKALDTFKTLVFDPMVNVVVGKVIGLAGWLAWGPISFLVTKVIVYVADVIYAELRGVINFNYIMLLNEKHHAAYVDAHLELKGIAKSKGIDSPEFKVAREKRKKALAEFVRYGATR